jgi:hypothetical protein
MWAARCSCYRRHSSTIISASHASLLLLAMCCASAAARGHSVPAEAPQCTSAEEKPQWPTFHPFNAAHRSSTGQLTTDHLNDANAIFE